MNIDFRHAVRSNSSWCERLPSASAISSRAKFPPSADGLAITYRASSTNELTFLSRQNSLQIVITCCYCNYTDQRMFLLDSIDLPTPHRRITSCIHVKLDSSTSSLKFCRKENCEHSITYNSHVATD